MIHKYQSNALLKRFIPITLRLNYLIETNGAVVTYKAKALFKRLPVAYGPNINGGILNNVSSFTQYGKCERVILPESGG
ncbi:hypothetical protein GCM10011500_41430 [Mucilaginibacter rubeus]|jgi:hypothetical protein|nr:hypothetical protein GCM10011500_41430 [Mucilaginibacter rubeus]